MKKIYIILFATSLLFGEDGFLKKVWDKLNEMTMVSPEQVAEVDQWMTMKSRTAYYDAKTGTYRIESYVPSMENSRRIRFFDNAFNVWHTSRTKYEVYIVSELLKPNAHHKEE